MVAAGIHRVGLQQHQCRTCPDFNCLYPQLLHHVHFKLRDQPCAAVFHRADPQAFRHEQFYRGVPAGHLFFNPKKNKDCGCLYTFSDHRWYCRCYVACLLEDFAGRDFDRYSPGDHRRRPPLGRGWVSWADHHWIFRLPVFSVQKNTLLSASDSGPKSHKNQARPPPLPHGSWSEFYRERSFPHRIRQNGTCGHLFRFKG